MSGTCQMRHGTLRLCTHINNNNYGISLMVIVVSGDTIQISWWQHKKIKAVYIKPETHYSITINAHSVQSVPKKAYR